MIQAKLWTKSKIPECEWRQFQEKVIRIWDNLTDPGGISRVHSQVGNNCIAGAHFVRARFDIFLVPILLCRWWSLCSFRSFISNQSTQVGETNSIITVITHDNYQIKMWNQEKRFKWACDQLFAGPVTHKPLLFCYSRPTEEILWGRQGGRLKLLI